MTQPFSFNISLSVLDHLGRNLYRNFITVLGEAITNSWDAEAENVYIEIDKDGKYFSIRDDGIGMDETDFRNKFLNVGYSKRKMGESLSPNKNRPYIGRKGIGKLALLSCAQRIHIASKTSDTDYIGGIIDNKTLDEAITDDSTPEEYPLELLNKSIFNTLKRGHKHGTIIYFENTNEGINNNIETLRRLIAMHFRFSLIDPSFSISVNGEEVNFNDLKELSKNTEFLWTINKFNDPFLETFNLKEKLNIPEPTKAIEGFIASVEKPSNLNIFGARERTGIDVFVNGRLRETNILKHTPGFATRHIASYLYGQIHLDILDDTNSDNNEDIFTTNREGIKLDSKIFQELLETIETEILHSISIQWNEWRIKDKPKALGYLGIATKNNAARKKDFIKKIKASPNLEQDTKDSLVKNLEDLSLNNASVYRDLFILENIFREFLRIRGIHNREDLNREFPDDEYVQGIPDIKGEKCPECKKYTTHKKGEKGCLDKIKEMEGLRKRSDRGQFVKSNKIIKTPSDFNYLSLVSLGILVDRVNEPPSGENKPLTMESYAKAIRPVRNAVMHTNEISQLVMESEQITDVIDMIDELCSKSPKP